VRRKDLAQFSEHQVLKWQSQTLKNRRWRDTAHTSCSTPNTLQDRDMPKPSRKQATRLKWLWQFWVQSPEALNVFLKDFVQQV